MVSNAHYLHRMTVLGALAALAPAVGHETLCNTMLPVVLSCAKDKVCLVSTGALSSKCLQAGWHVLCQFLLMYRLQCCRKWMNERITWQRLVRLHSRSVCHVCRCPTSSSRLRRCWSVSFPWWMPELQIRLSSPACRILQMMQMWMFSTSHGKPSFPVRLLLQHDVAKKAIVLDTEVICLNNVNKRAHEMA